MRGHPDPIRYALMDCFIYVRGREVTDDIVRIFLEIIHRTDGNAEKRLDRELLQELKRVDGKSQALYHVAQAVVEHPDGTVREVIFPRVKEEIFHNLIQEFETTGPQDRLLQKHFMKETYNRHYRRRVPLVLEDTAFGGD